jgi:GcrA cell cycle regulator
MDGTDSRIVAGRHCRSRLPSFDGSRPFSSSVSSPCLPPRPRHDGEKDIWTAENVAKLRRLWAEDLSAAEIGRQIGTTKNAVVGKAHRLNLRSRPSPILRGATPKPPAIRRLRAGEAMLPRLESVPPSTSALPETPFLAELLSSRECQWPLWGNGTPRAEKKFCGEQASIERPYCPVHCCRAYVRMAEAVVARINALPGPEISLDRAG